MMASTKITRQIQSLHVENIKNVTTNHSKH